MGSSFSRECDALGAAAAASSAKAPLPISPTSNEASHQHVTTLPLNDKSTSPGLKRKSNHEVSSAPKSKRSKAQKVKTDDIMDASEPVDLTDIKEFIQNYEAAPHPLTPKQDQAINYFKLAIAKKPPPPPPVPILGDEDWISALKNYCDMEESKRNGVHHEYEDIIGEFLGPNQPQFRCVCHFKGPLAPDLYHFPSEDYGFVVTDPDKGTLVAPLFFKKKDARQYAASCTITWLRRQGQTIKMLTRGQVGKMPTRNPPALPRTLAVVKQKHAPLEKPKAVTTSASPSVPTNNSKVDEEDIPAMKMVHILCNKLKMPSPSYKLTPIHTGPPGYYNGWADFGPQAWAYPENCGVVRNVFGSEETEQQIAEDVLKHLLKEDAKRMEDVRMVDQMEGGDCRENEGKAKTDKKTEEE